MLLNQPDDASSLITRTLYSELRGIAERVFASERPGHTLQPTALVNEACIRLMAHGLPPIPREQQLAIGARVLRQVLVDHARAHTADKRGGGWVRLELDRAELGGDDGTLVDLEAVHAAMDRLRLLDERQAEVVMLRVYSGMTMEQIASVLGVSKRTAEADWTIARAWLRRELARAGGAGA
jgi:RNA polymerase sigma-70 factor (ECF subfamily)